jgi:hypothetical protein
MVSKTLGVPIGRSPEGELIKNVVFFKKEVKFYYGG